MQSQNYTETIRPIGRDKQLEYGWGDVLRWYAVRAWRTIEIWQERARQRRALDGLSDAALKDIGLTKADVWSEVQKPRWRK